MIEKMTGLKQQGNHYIVAMTGGQYTFGLLLTRRRSFYTLGFGIRTLMVHRRRVSGRAAKNFTQ